MRQIFWFFLIWFMGCGVSDVNQIPPELKGALLPKCDVLLLDSATTFHVSQIPEGRPTLIILFSPNCPTSRGQINEIVNHNEELKAFNIVALSHSTLGELRDFIGKYDSSKTSQIIFGKDTGNLFLDYFDPIGVPYLAIYGNDRKLRNVYLGKKSVGWIRQVGFTHK